MSWSNRKSGVWGKTGGGGEEWEAGGRGTISTVWEMEGGKGHGYTLGISPIYSLSYMDIHTVPLPPTYL